MLLQRGMFTFFQSYFNNTSAVKALLVMLCLPLCNVCFSQTMINPSNSPGYDSAKAHIAASGSTLVSFVTDSADYQPGSTVKFTGGGFFPNETVVLQVSLLGNPPGTGSAYNPFNAICDNDGNFTAYWYVDSQNYNRSLEATVFGMTSGYTSSVLFTDGTPSTSCYFAPDATYTNFPANDDGSLGPISLGFTFNLYGVSYTQCYINNNGNVTFTAANGAYSSTGFPNNIPMVAPFWADVDTRVSGSATVKYKVSAGRIVITWPGVAYYGSTATPVLLNQYQVILTDGNDAGVGLGNNVAFNYGDMQWTTGTASGGSAGFGGTPATVGVSKGDNVNYIQVGRFGLNSSVYDGGAGNTDGVNYLDYECFAFNVSNANNQPPSISGAPNNDTLVVTCGATSTLALTFLPPEVNQTVSSTINIGSMCNVTTSTTSGATSVATISVTGSSCNMGYNTITYTASDNFNPVGVRTYNLTVRVVAASTTASSNSPICAGNTLNLATTAVTGASGYNWTGPNGFTATTQNPTIANATTAASGTYNVSVALPNGCAAATSSTTVTVNARPTVPANTGTASVCIGSTTTLSNATTGGVFSSATTSVATVNASTGVVTGVAAGTSVIKYLVVNANGCRDSASTTVTVSANPTVNALTGTQTVCVGSTTTFSSTTTGGTYSSNNTAIATVNASTGVITGAAAGTATISYAVTNANGCTTTVTRTVTVNAGSALPAITGTTTTCIGSTTTLSNATSGGTWSSSNTSIATINSSTGVVTGVAAGTATITYTVVNGSGCSSIVTTTVTINPFANP